MKIISIVIIKTGGTDKIILNADLPCATYPYVGNQSVSFDAVYDGGEKYCEENFPGVPIEIIKER